MASDDIIWHVINQQFCSFKIKLKAEKQTFCRNEHNVTGFCNRQSCPLANSRYATVRPDPETQALCLYIKSPERSHLPSQWWEKVRLSNNYEKALAQIDDKLLYWSKFYIHKCKQRLTRLTQVAIRSRKIAKEEERLGERIVPRRSSKIRHREATRERKAESAAKVERAIERELLERLRSGAYGDNPINVEENVWKKVLRGLERAEKGEEFVEEEDLDEEDEKEAEVEYVSDLDESDLGETGEMEDFDDWLGDESEDDGEGGTDSERESDISASDTSENGSDQPSGPGEKRKRNARPPKARKKPTRVEIEYETELPQKEALLVS